MAVAKKFYVVIFALFFLLTIPSAHATSTWVQGLYRFQPWADYIGGGIPVVADQPALLTDWSVAIRILISYPSDGDSWDWEYYSPDGSVSRTSQIFSASLNGQLGCFLTVGIYPAPPPGCAGTVVIVADITAFAIKRIQCEVPGNWRAVLKFTPGGSTIAQTLFDQPFTLASIGPVVNVALNPNEITPEIIDKGGNQAPGKTAITIRVTDSGCPNLPIPNADVSGSAKAVPLSGGHDHLVTERGGLGKFTVTGRTASLDANGLPQGKTNDQGQLTGIFYTAGQLGIEENIIANATTSTATGLAHAEGRSLLTTKVPNLSILAYSPFAHFSGAKKDFHTANHYGTAGLRVGINQSTMLYNTMKTKGGSPYEGTLGINDMSLPYGGVFDLDGTLKASNDPGHFSHRTGIDVDFDSKDSSKNPLDLLLLNEITCRFGGSQRQSGGIHFRFDGARCKPE